MTYRKTLAALVAGTALTFSGMAVAQESAEMDAPLEMPSYEADQLDAWVAAFSEVVALRDRYAEPLQSAETQEQQAAIIEHANSEIFAAIKAVDGIDLETYEQIAMAAQTDAELAERLTRRIEAANQT